MIMPFKAVVRFIWTNGKRVAVSLVGFGLLALGLVMIVTPGPGIVFLIAGLAVLATEYVWAERALEKAKEQASRAKDAVLRKKRGPHDRDDPGR